MYNECIECSISQPETLLKQDKYIVKNNDEKKRVNNSIEKNTNF